MNFPREEMIDLGGMEYFEEARWRLFKDIDDGIVLPGLNVMVALGNHYTILKADEFRRLAERILRQLE